jgi:hypothetical protein
MNTLTERELSKAPTVSTSLDEFFARILADNPFTDNRINAPSVADVDVAAIHQSAFDRLTGLAYEARDQKRGIGAVLWGEAGIGKSHLLSRLARWADADDRACRVYIHNLQAGPERLPRTLLKLVLGELTEGRERQFHKTALYALTRAFLVEMIDKSTGTCPWPLVQRAFRLLGARLAAGEPSRAALVDSTTSDVLFSFFQSATRAWTKGANEEAAALAVRWLSGETLDVDESRLLGLPPGRWRDEPLALADNQQIKQVLVAISRMALSRGQPFVLCFDQVDNLDSDQAAALARFLEALIDSAPNLLIVTAGIKPSLLHWRQTKIIQDSAWDRLAQFEIDLHRLNPAEALRIVASRLVRALKSHIHLDAIKQQIHQDALFPLGDSWQQEFIDGKVEVRPRDMINWAREGWRREQAKLKARGGMDWLSNWGKGNSEGTPTETDRDDLRALIDRKVLEKLNEHKGRRLASRRSLPPSAANLAGIVAKLLKQCRDTDGLYDTVEVLECDSEKKPPQHDLLLRRRLPNGNVATTGLLFLDCSNGNATRAALLRLLHAAPMPDRQFLVTDERQPPSIAEKGQEFLNELNRRISPPFRHLSLRFMEVAELDALVSLVGFAQAGDLEIEPQAGRSKAIKVPEVIDSLHRQGCFLASRLLRELLISEVAEPGA